MYNFSKRIYNLDIKHFLIYTYKYFFFLVNHRSHEMITKSFLWGLRLNAFRYINIYHVNKLFLCNSVLIHKTFDFNNYLNFFLYNELITPILYFKNSFYTDKYYKYNLKQNYLNYYSFFNQTIKTFFFSHLNKVLDVKKIKFYIVYIYLSFFSFFKPHYIWLFYTKSFTKSFLI